MRHKEILDRLLEINPQAVIIEGLDEAIIGYTQNNGFPNVAVYDTELCVSLLSSNGMSLEDAVDYFEYNVLGSHFGENSPIFVSL